MKFHIPTWTDNKIWSIIPLPVLAVWSVLHGVVPWKADIKLKEYETYLQFDSDGLLADMKEKPLSVIS